MKILRSTAFFAAASLMVASALHAGTVTKAGAGIELTDVNSWVTSVTPGSGDDATWDTSSNGGTQTLAGPATWNTMVTTNIGSTLTLSGSAITFAQNANLAVITTGAATVNIGNDVILSSGGTVITTPTTAAGNTTNRVQISVASGGVTTFGNITATGTAVANDANIMFRGAGATTVNGTITIDGQLYKGDGGTLTLNSANSIGWIHINNGILLAGNDQAFGAGPIYLASGGGQITIASKDGTARNLGNALDMTLFGTSATANFGQSSTGTGALTFGALNVGTIKVKIQTNVGTSFSSVTGTTGGIIKSGAGTLTINGTNTYTGGTTISAGTLNIASGAQVVVSNVGRINITGGALTVDGTIKLTTTSATIANAGSITLNGTSVLDLGSVFNGQANGSTYQLITGTTATSGNFSSILFTGATNFDTVTFDNTNGKLTFALAAVPEPSTYGLLGAGALVAVAIRRRRKTAEAEV